MRLLKYGPDKNFELVTCDSDHPPPYAILSHTWIEGQEVAYDELVTGTGRDKAGYAKIRFCGERAAEDGLEHFWVDSCCINKATNDELSTAINSMFRWYQRAAKCYVYLSDVHVPEEVDDAQSYPITWVNAFRRSRWFTRGWTLQELLAPASVEFFSAEGKRLGSKISLEQEIHNVTQIPIQALRGKRLPEFTEAERMSWTAKRETTVKEDKAYCLLGIFGVFMPLIYGEGEEHALQRLKEEIQKRQDGRGAQGSRSQSAASLLPFPRNTSFVGREDQLRILEEKLSALHIHQRITIYGLGGCGKTALAVEYAYRVLAKRPNCLVFWVPAISQDTFELAYREIGILLRIQGITDDNADVKQLVKDKLSNDETIQWLMIVDNADDLEVLMAHSAGDARSDRLIDYLPRSDRGTILFTTRGRKAAEQLTQNNILELNKMVEAEAKQLMKQRIVNQSLLADEQAVNQLLGLLTYLPLALVQAVAFINRNDVSISEYVELFSEGDTETELFSEHFEDQTRYREMESTIAKTWHISFNQIRKEDPLAVDYLSFMACIDRVNIPLSLLPQGGTHLQRIKAIGTLKGYAFITERNRGVQQLQKEKFFDIHRLVQMASVLWLEEHGEITGWVGKAGSRLDELLPHGEHNNREVWVNYLAHAIHVAGLEQRLGDDVKASLLDRVGRCQVTLGQYAAAEMTHRQVLALREKNFGSEHNGTLISMNEVGRALESQGKYTEAEQMQKQTLARRKKVSGSEHPETLMSMNNLATVLNSQGKYLEAEALNRETVKLREKMLGPDHPDTLMSMDNLASVLNNQGKFEEGEAINRRTLATYEKVLGPEHPDTLMSMDNLALLLNNRGKSEEAELLNRHSLALHEKVLGVEHPDTLISVYSLAYYLGKRHRYEESTALFQRACAGLSTSLGHNHPRTRSCRQHYSEMLASQKAR